MYEKLLYLTDTYKFEHDTTVLRIDCDEVGSYLVFDETIFHPQGGGQPSDAGEVMINNESIFVQYASYMHNEVRHYYENNKVEINPGDLAKLKINRVQRIENAKYHSAGHLIHGIVEALSDNKIVVVKGYHYRNGPYVEFNGELPENPNGSFRDMLNDEITKSISSNYCIKPYMIDCSHDESQYCCCIKDISGNKQLRIIEISDVNTQVPCGGTHVRSTGELAGLSITKIKMKSGNIRMSYTIIS